MKVLLCLSFLLLLLFNNSVNANELPVIKNFPIASFCSNVDHNVTNVTPDSPWVWGPFKRRPAFEELCTKYPYLDGGMRGKIKDLISFEKISESRYQAKGNDTAGCTFVTTFHKETGYDLTMKTEISCPKSPEVIAIEKQTKKMCEAQKVTCIAGCPRDRITPSLPDHSCEQRCKSISCN